MLDVGGYQMLPHWPLFAAFALAGLVLNLVPGVDMAYVISSSARSGVRGGMAASLGIATGALGHTIMAVAGVSALIAASPTLFDGLKWVGAAYLVYIAFNLLRVGRANVQGNGAEYSLTETYGRGVLVNLLNPKVALFFVAFLPQFIDPIAKSRPLQMLALGIWFNFVGTIVNCLVGFLASSAATAMGRFAWLTNAARRLAALTFVGLAVRLIWSERRSGLV